MIHIVSRNTGERIRLAERRGQWWYFIASADVVDRVMENGAFRPEWEISIS